MAGVDLLARAIPTDPTSYGADLSVEMIGALRQAFDQGIPFVNVIGLLGATGYELRIVPTENADLSADPEYQFAQLMGLDGDADTEGDGAGPLDNLMYETRMRLGLTKGISFDVENRIIARNKKRKVAQEPHPFRAARWSTRTGVQRCVMCGLTQPESGACTGLAYMKAADTFTPPAGVRDAAARALVWIADGTTSALLAVRDWDDRPPSGYSESASLPRVTLVALIDASLRR